jgi:hypothetical protein
VIAGMFISGGEGAIGVPATLLRDSSTADLQPIDEFGSFLFSGVTPGDYRIEIELPDTLLVIDPLAVP